MKRHFLLTALLSLVCLAPVHAEYVPAFTVVRETDSFHVMGDGQFTQTIESLLRIDTAQGVNTLGERKIGFNAKLETIELVQAYTELKDGTRIEVPAERIRIQDSNTADEAIYSDEKVMVIIFPQVEVGAHLYYRVNSVQHTPVFAGHFYWSNYYSPHVRVEEAIVNLTHESGIAIGVDIDRVQGGKVTPLPEDAPGTVRYRFTFAQGMAYPAESARLALSDFAPHIALSSFADYSDFANAYQQRAKPMAAVSPAISKFAKELVAGAKDEHERVRRLYNWVSNNIRYVAVYVGAGGWVPHDAKSVLDNRYGDCKDHVVLLESMLAAVGIDSSPALIGTDPAFALPKLPVSTPFDHVITYVPSLDLYLDSTAQFAPVGTLPSWDQDKPVLLTASGKVAKTPARDIARDKTHTSVMMSVLDKGGVVGRSTYTPQGNFEVESRSSQFSYLNRNQVPIVDKLLSRFLESGGGVIEDSEPMMLDKPWKVDASFELDPLVNVPGPSAMPIPVGLAPGRIKEMSGYKPPAKRRYPAVCGSSAHSETIILKFPKTVKVQRIPKDVAFRRGPLQYKASYKLGPQMLVVQRRYESHRVEPVCNEKDDRDWDALREVLQRDLRSQVFFK